MSSDALLTVLIPIAPYHEAIADEAVASCLAQTAPVDIITIHDVDRRGAGWARNQGLAQVATPFVTFLDADDVLDPQFAQLTAVAFAAGGERRYIYTDWYQDAEHIRAPDCAWMNQTWHIVTALVPTAWARAVGGFDESLRGGEDSDFYLKLCASGRCGRRLGKPLVHYRRGGQRGSAFVNSPDFARYQDLMTQRYGGKQMACCGEIVNETPLGERGEGDILAQALWQGNRRERGAITGRIYPRAGNGALVWVDTQDATAAPHLWRPLGDPVVEPAQPRRTVSPAEAIAAFVFGGSAERSDPPPMPTWRGLAFEGAPKPDVNRVLELYRWARGAHE